MLNVQELVALALVIGGLILGGLYIRALLKGPQAIEQAAPREAYWVVGIEFDRKDNGLEYTMTVLDASDREQFIVISHDVGHANNVSFLVQNLSDELRMLSPAMTVIEANGLGQSIIDRISAVSDQPVTAYRVTAQSKASILTGVMLGLNFGRITDPLDKLPAHDADGQPSTSLALAYYGGTVFHARRQMEFV